MPTYDRAMLPAADLYDLVYGDKRYADEAARIDEIVRDNCPTAQTLLDVGCGTGRHLEHLSSRFHVEGLDASADLLDGARRRLPDVPLHIGDMRSFSLGKTFDVVTCLFSALGYTLTEDGMRAAVAAMAAHVAEDGLLVIEPWLTPERWRAGTVSLDVADDGDVKVARACVTERAGDVSRLVFTYLVASPSGAESFTEVHELGLFPAATMIDAVASTGLDASWDDEGIGGRGLLLGRRAASR